MELCRLSAEDAKNPAILRELADLEKECFEDSWSEKILADTIENPFDTIWILWENEKIEAYCDLRVLAGEGELMRIAVRKDRRGLGLGKRLMETMLADLVSLGCTEWILEVREGNQNARKLYEMYGFVQEGIRRNYYKNPTENAVLMGRRQL